MKDKNKSSKSAAKNDKKFIDDLGRKWDTALGDLEVGSKFFLYGRELCTVLKIEEGFGAAGVTYLWNGKECYGLPPIPQGKSWHAEEVKQSSKKKERG